jgi:uncharacterized protein YhaN
MNILGDFIKRVDSLYPVDIDNEELNALLTTIQNQGAEIEELHKELEKAQAKLEKIKAAEKKEAKASTANTEINAEEYAGTITSNAGVYKTFVNLSDWKGMSVDLKESDYVVLDSDVISRACLNQRLQLML